MDGVIVGALDNIRRSVEDSRAASKQELSDHRREDNDNFRDLHNKVDGGFRDLHKKVADINAMVLRWDGSISVIKYLMGLGMALAAGDTGMHLWEMMHR